ncbi:MAG: 30S ribosomal protein S8e [Nanoarchaeota archaeon]|nr:30S ribosomal protein S8e [Nanoarchaeota archaeon]
MKKGKKISGGKYKKSRGKKLHELPGQRRIVKLGEEKKKTQRERGGKMKKVLLRSNLINIILGKKSQKVEIKNVLETPSNRFLARQNVLTKGTIVETDAGKVKVTNRPSQEGIVNGVLVSESK